MAESELNIHQKKNLIIDALGGALLKTGRMTKGGSYDFHTIDDVHDALRPLVVQYGVSFQYSLADSNQIVQQNSRGETQNINEKILTMMLVNCDNPEDFISGEESGFGIDFLDKGPGKATAYAVKTWLVNVFHLKGQPDLDGDSGGVEYINEKQVGTINKLLTETESDMDVFLDWMNVPSVEAITSGKAYEKAEKGLLSKKGQK